MHYTWQEHREKQIYYVLLIIDLKESPSLPILAEYDNLNLDNEFHFFFNYEKNPTFSCM